MRRLLLLLAITLFYSCTENNKQEDCLECYKLYYFHHESVTWKEADLVKYETVLVCEDDVYDPQIRVPLNYPYTFYRIDCEYPQINIK